MTVEPMDIRQRVLLPWLPKDLHSHFIVFRRAHPTRSDEYVECLRVRRNLVGRIIVLLSRKGTWRAHRDTESMHQYFDVHDFHDLQVLEEILPEDDIPQELHFENSPGEDQLATAALSSTEFVDLSLIHI